MKVRIKKLNDKAVMPKKAHASDAGFDLVATSMEIDVEGNIVYGTGLAFEIPEGHVGLVFPRSSICKKDLVLSNAVGIVDSHYRGEVMFKFRPTMMAQEGDTSAYESGAVINTPFPLNTYALGERIGQLIIMPYPVVEFEEAEELSDTDRGKGGYGSTGK